jgi:hypothetical protein
MHQRKVSPDKKYMNIIFASFFFHFIVQHPHAQGHSDNNNNNIIFSIAGKLSIGRCLTIMIA